MKALLLALAIFLVVRASAEESLHPDPEPVGEEAKPNTDREVNGGLPKVTEEEHNSKVPPDHMRCDCCSAAAFWIHRSLKLRHKEDFRKKLKEIDVLETIDDICLPKTFSRTYGIKYINGKHRLSGGGLKGFYIQAPAAGTLMPGQWLNHQCREIQGEIGEDDLYDLFWKYHVKLALENSDVPFFREVCIKRLKRCSEKEALESYDGYEKKDQKDI